MTAPLDELATVTVEYRFVSLVIVGPLLGLLTYDLVVGDRVVERCTVVVTPEPRPPTGGAGARPANDNEITAAVAA